MLATLAQMLDGRTSSLVGPPGNRLATGREMRCQDGMRHFMGQHAVEYPLLGAADDHLDRSDGPPDKRVLGLSAGRQIRAGIDHQRYLLVPLG